MFLRRPISVCDVEGDKLTIIYKVVGKGTAAMSAMAPGQALDILTGLGNGYDLTLSGDHPVLLGGGSVRIHQSDIQEKMFEVIGLSKEEANEKFGFLLTAFKYGVPPHAGLAYGVDRFVMLLAGADSIREVIAFPKNKDAADLMSGAPDVVDPAQLTDLHIAVEEEQTEG